MDGMGVTGTQTALPGSSLEVAASTREDLPPRSLTCGKAFRGSWKPVTVAGSLASIGAGVFVLATTPFGGPVSLVAGITLIAMGVLGLAGVRQSTRKSQDEDLQDARAGSGAVVSLHSDILSPEEQRYQKMYHDFLTLHSKSISEVYRLYRGGYAYKSETGEEFIQFKRMDMNPFSDAVVLFFSDENNKKLLKSLNYFIAFEGFYNYVEKNKEGLGMNKDDFSIFHNLFVFGGAVAQGISQENLENAKKDLGKFIGNGTFMAYEHAQVIGI